LQLRLGLLLIGVAVLRSPDSGQHRANVPVSWTRVWRCRQLM
jgi:hypothetical protein